MRRLLKVTAMTGLLTLLKMAMGFVIAKVVAIYTGPTGMAMLGQVQSLVSGLNGIVNAPASSGVIRFTAEHNKQGISSCVPWWRAALQWILILSAIIIPIGLLLSKHISIWLFNNETYTWLVIITVCVLPLSAIGTLCNSVINGLQQYRRYITLGMLSAFLSGSVMLTMIVRDNIRGALLAATIQSALIGIIMLIANMRQPWCKLCYWWGQSNSQARGSIANYMLMAITSAVTIPISMILVRMILVRHVGWVETGQWQAVWKISEVYLGVITMALSTYYLPRLSSLIGVDAIISEVHKTALIIMPIVSIMALGVYFSRDLVISILFTDDFAGARNLFAIQLIGDVVKIFSWLYAYPMLSRGATKWYISTEVIFSSLFVIISYLLISRVGVQGANYAYLLNYIMYFFIMIFNIRRISVSGC